MLENIEELFKHIKLRPQMYVGRDFAKLGRKRLTRMFPVEKEGDCGMEKLIEYLDCYLGNRSFNVVVSFVEGESEVALLV